jgi:hypothetical protein
MDHFQALRTAPHFAETTHPRTARQAILLLRREVEEPQGEKAGSIRDPAEHLPPAAKRDLGEQHIPFHRGTLTRYQLTQRNDAGPIFVPQRQQEQQVMGGFDAQCAQPQGERVANAA